MNDRSDILASLHNLDLADLVEAARQFKILSVWQIMYGAQPHFMNQSISTVELSVSQFVIALERHGITLEDVTDIINSKSLEQNIKETL